MAKHSLYLAIATCFILLTCINKGEAAKSPTDAISSEITLTNWISHPEIKKIRKIYQDIKKGLETNELVTMKIRYDYESEECTLAYPTKWEEIAYNKQKLTRMYLFSQIISHGDTLNVERYYDEKGQLRFVLILWEFSGTERIYLNAKGDIIFSVKQEGEELTLTHYEKDDFLVNPSRSESLYNSFLTIESPRCPILE